ncbi:hypothetical protein [Aliidiomarina indica]|uniref:hypothetical protein n=1 Tax=Aliidiomarina indica TaxID=2749147 RepID=UPI0018906F98|nr:hypothetical protein [Aliidiomarina indica]
MKPLWVQKNSSSLTEAEPDLAADIKRLRSIVNKFESPYVEIQHQQRVTSIRSKWPLYALDLCDVSAHHSASQPSAVNDNTEVETS